MKNLLKISFNPKRIYGLDILRALAILPVVAGHGAALMPEKISKKIGFLFYDGVSIFFVLSGFLIGGILIKILEKGTFGSQQLFNFWIRRWFRTIPNYFLILTTLLLLNYLFVNNFNVWDYKLYFLFSQNLFSNHPSFFPEAWSLSIEEWFYLLIPIIIYILLKLFKVSSKNSVIITAVFIIFCVTAFRCFKFNSLAIQNYHTWDLTFIEVIT